MRGALARTVVLASVIAALSAAPAQAAPRTGIVDVRIGANAAATKGRIEVTWVARCTGKVRTWRGSTYSSAPFARNPRRPRHDGPSESESFFTKLRSITESDFSARHVGGYRWRGTLRVSVILYRGSKRLARCRVPATAWTARAARMHVQVVRDPRDGSPPFTVNQSSPRNAVSLRGDRKALEVNFGDDLPGVSFGYDIEIAAPGATLGQRGGRDLRRGRFRNARRYAFHGKRPGLDFGGNGNGCNEVFGEYDIKSIRFTRSGMISAVRFSFAAHCESPLAPPTLGSVTYRR